MPRRSVTASAHHLTGTWEGVEVRELLTRAGAPAGEALRGLALATAVAVTGADGYRVVFGIAEFDPAPRSWRPKSNVRPLDRLDPFDLSTLRPSTRDVFDGAEQALHFVRRRVTRTPGANDAIVGMTETCDR